MTPNSLRANTSTSYIYTSYLKQNNIRDSKQESHAALNAASSGVVPELTEFEVSSPRRGRLDRVKQKAKTYVKPLQANTSSYQRELELRE